MLSCYPQVAGNDDVIQVIRAVADGVLNLRDSRRHAELFRLQQHAPVLADFIVTCLQDSGVLPDDVRALLHQLLQILVAPFQDRQSHSNTYPPPTEEPLSFFPVLPRLHGDAAYRADGAVSAADRDTCRKNSYGHPTLSPGIFTVYCEHGVCYGFEILQKCESPRHPFRIFKSRFNQAPELIIYDNACRLHIYSLNREPQFFQNTKFLVDRFHWRGHVGCSRGYCLDAYNDKRIRAINSQVNEQANSGLQRIRGQLAYMSVNNFKLHCSLFLALKNMDKMSVLSVTNLVL